MKTDELKVGNWIMHNGFAWRIAEIKKENASEWDRLLVLHRDDLEQKKRMLENDTWYPGRTTVTSILRVHHSESFELCDDDTKQFAWQTRT